MNYSQAESSDLEPPATMPDEVRIRTTLDRLIHESGDDYASLSRMLRRNPAYIQQYIKRGVPRRLSEQDRRFLAQYFGISEALLGAPAPPVPQQLSPSSSRHQCIEIRRDRASASGPESLLVDPLLLLGLPDSREAALTAHQVEGDSMAPTLHAGDLVLVNTADRAMLRDGLYAIEANAAIAVKRLSINPATRFVTILSDNAAYPSFANCDPERLKVIGRIVWFARLI